MQTITEVPSTSVRRNLTEHLLAATRGQHIAVMHYGRRLAVIVDAEWYEAALRAMSVCDAMAPRDDAE